MHFFSFVVFSFKAWLGANEKKTNEMKMNEHNYLTTWLFWRTFRKTRITHGEFLTYFAVSHIISLVYLFMSIRQYKSQLHERKHTGEQNSQITAK